MPELTSGQAGGVSDELASHIIDASSDDELVQDVLDEMKETISSLPACNQMEDMQTHHFSLPLTLMLRKLYQVLMSLMNQQVSLH